jgi:drug/metabolite transporter (DMT)-like permease
MLEKKANPLNLFFLTVISLIFLSANSIFCRAALVDYNIDAYTFTFFRLFFGSITLVLILLYTKKEFRLDIRLKGNWISSLMLFLYAICFSYSYLNMEAGIGTLILFAVVQLSMILVSSANQKCTNMQCKSAPLSNTYLLEISNNPASLFCFNL